MNIKGSVNVKYSVIRGTFQYRLIRSLKSNLQFSGFLLMLLFLLAPAPSYSQKFPFVYYNVENNLPQSTVTSIIQDSKRYLWFGTLDGISRFDGREFVNFSTDHGLIDKSVRAIYEDEKGIIWVGTATGVSKFQNGSFTTVIGKDKGLHPCVAITGDGSGTVFLGTVGGGLITVFRGTHIRITTENGMLDNTVRSLLFDDRKLYIGTSKGFSIYDGEKFTHYTDENGFKNTTVRSIFRSNDGTIWLGTANDGIAAWKDGKFTWFKLPVNEDVTVYTIEQGKFGNMWFGTTVGVFKYNWKTFTLYNDEVGLSAKTVLCIKRDLENVIWFGLNDGGVNKLRSEKFMFYDRSTGLINNLVYAVSEDEKGNIWVGTNEGASRISPNSEIKNFTERDGLTSSSIRVIKRDPVGRLWFGTVSGVTLLENGNFRKFTKANGFTDDRVGAVLVSRTGRVWFGTDHEGVYVYDGKSFVNYRTQDGLVDDQIWAITEAPNGAIWFASYNKGITVYQNGKFSAETAINKELADANIYAITADQNSRIWIATQNKGFYIYENGSLKNYSVKDGLSNNVCYFFVNDRQGGVWIGTNGGLNRFDGKNFRHYTNHSGLISNEFNLGAAYLDSKGILWFGSVKGLVRYNPAFDVLNTLPPAVYLTRFRIFEKDTEAKNDLVLDYTENYLKFDFIALSFPSPQEIEYQYRLTGVDIDWQSSKQTTIQYTSLSDGEYVFEVRARNSDGVWSSVPMRFSFTILPPFWQTWWFRVIAFIIILSAIYLTFRIRTYRLQLRNIELERMVTVRTKELEAEKNKSDDLLHNILPAYTVKELKEKGSTIPREYKSISILFTDFKGFTAISSSLHPNELVSELNDIFVNFDAIIERYGLEKLKTIGDSYMIAGGLPVESNDHACRIILAGLELLQFIEERNKSKKIAWSMRAGVHSGNVVAGVVGKKKFTYDVWGDTVNVASRMESSGESGRINISESTYQLVKEYFVCEYRGKVMAKGKGEVDMYFITGIKDCVYEMYPFTTAAVATGVS